MPNLLAALAALRDWPRRLTAGAQLGAPRRLALGLPALAVALALVLTGVADAEPDAGSHAAQPRGSAAPLADAGPAEAGVEASPPAPVSKQVARLRQQAATIEALIGDTLDVAVDPATLFDVALGDEPAVVIEAERLRLIVAAVDDCLAAPANDAGELGDGEALPDCASAYLARRAAGSLPEPSDAGVGDGSADAASSPLPALDEPQWLARVALDRARLAFYSLPPDRRRALLDQHAERQKSSAEAKTQKELSDAERKADEAAAERERALEAVRKARTEAARLVAEEHARLLGLKKRHAEVEGELIRKEQRLRKRQESVLSWRRRVTEVVETRDETGRTDGTTADQLHGEVNEALSEVRGQHQEALTALRSGASSVPATGPNPLAGLAVDVDRKDVDRLRVEIEGVERRLRAREAEWSWQRAKTLMEALTSLNQHRLQLQPHLSDDRRAAVTGFGAEGRSVARAEAAQVWLVLQYHLLATEQFIDELGREDKRRGSALEATWIALKWLLPIAVFIWWRRQARRWLEGWRDRAKETARRQGRASPARRAVKIAKFLMRVRRPIEWLLLIWAVVALLPEGARHLLEIELFWTVAVWALGGTLVVNTIDAVFATGDQPRQSGLQTAHLRLRSLRWIGRTIVTFGWVLAVTAKLVGQGTIYGWVWSTCWWSALPIGLAIVQWWRPVIFERIGHIRRKGAIAAWVGERSGGWLSFSAAVVGGAYLLGWGAIKHARAFLGRFDTTRKALAYLFRREIAKQAERRAESGESQRTYWPLGDKKYRALSPAKPSTELVPSVADKQVDEVIARIAAPGGGVFALVGERGSGKSTVLGRIQDQTEDTTLVRCPFGGDGFDRALRQALDLPADTELDPLRTKLEKRQGDNAVLLDDAHHLMRPVIDGLADFDHLLDLARCSSTSCTWVFAVDAVIWDYFERAREVRPLFDEVIALRPWAEEGIMGLLASRSEDAEVDARFDDLLVDLPDTADETDRQQARERTQANYYRLLWDYAAGNPGVALHFWRSSLRTADDGHEVVRLFTTPDTRDLERLPDSAIFVLRAIIQLEWATPEDIGAATMIGATEVADALRYSRVRGYVELEDDRYRVRWDWFRAITLFLQRRHLLVGNGD